MKYQINSWSISFFCLGIFIFYLFYHFFGYFGHFGYDDIHYARLAKQIADGHFNIGNDHYAYRWGITIPTAISYYFFGVNDQSSAIMPLLATFLSLLIVFFLLRDEIVQIRMLAIAMFALYSWTIFYSDKLMPDVFVAFAILLSVAVIHHYRFQAGKPRHFIHGVLFSVALLYGFLSKETMLLAFPLFLFYFLTDLFLKRNAKFWIYTIAISAVLALGYFSIVKLMTGSFTYRFTAMELGSYFNECSYDQLPLSATLKRIGYELVNVFVRSGLVVGLSFAIAAIFDKNIKDLLKTEDQRSFLISTLILLFASGNFMSVSYKSYMPLCPDPRHYLFLAPVAALAGAPVVYNFFYQKNHAGIILFLVVVAFIVSFVHNYENKYFTYLAFSVLILVRIFFAKNIAARWVNIFVAAFIVILFFHPIQAIQYARTTNYPVQKAMLIRHFKNSRDKNLVITDPVQKSFGGYYMEFDTTYTKFITFKEVKAEEIGQAQNIYIFMNGFTRYLSGMEWEYLPEYARNKPESIVKVEERNGIELYKCNDASVLLK